MNSKLREQGKREEKRRLKEFVENAYRCDPRVIAHKEAQRAERWAACASWLASVMQTLGSGLWSSRHCVQCADMQSRKGMCCLDEPDLTLCAAQGEKENREALGEAAQAGGRGGGGGRGGSQEGGGGRAGGGGGCGGAQAAPGREEADAEGARAPAQPHRWPRWAAQPVHVLSSQYLPSALLAGHLLIESMACRRVPRTV